jgi:carbonic anhydrase/acetyltransferase-like protein (isoleucine patch superfamily)
VNPDLRCVAYGTASPAVAASTFVAPDASLSGSVTIGDNSSVWYGSVVRGDLHPVSIGSFTALQDRVSVSGATTLGNSVTVGAGSILHSATIKNNCSIGMGSILDGAVVEEGAIVQAGASVSTKVPSGQVWGGVPAKYIREVTAEEKEMLASAAEQYSQLAQIHLEEVSKSADEVQAELDEYELLQPQEGTKTQVGPIVLKQ